MGGVCCNIFHEAASFYPCRGRGRGERDTRERNFGRTFERAPLDNPEINNAVGRRGLFVPAKMKSVSLRVAADRERRRWWRKGRISGGRRAVFSGERGRVTSFVSWNEKSSGTIRGFGVGAEFFLRGWGRINLRWSHGRGEVGEVGEVEFSSIGARRVSRAEKMWRGGCCNLTFC